MKKTVSIILCILMLISVIPFASAVDSVPAATISSSIIIGDVLFYEENSPVPSPEIMEEYDCYPMPGIGGCVNNNGDDVANGDWWLMNSNGRFVLTLNSATINSVKDITINSEALEAAADDLAAADVSLGMSYGILSKYSLTINMVGTSYIGTVAKGEIGGDAIKTSVPLFGIMCDDVTFTGTGSLTVSGLLMGVGVLPSVSSLEGSVSFNGGSVKVMSEYMAICAANVSFNGGSLNAKGGNVAFAAGSIKKTVANAMKASVNFDYDEDDYIVSASEEYNGSDLVAFDEDDLADYEYVDFTYSPKDEETPISRYNGKQQLLMENLTDYAIVYGGNVGTAIMDYGDVSASDWYYSAVEYVFDKKLMNGLTATSFEPNGVMTRAMLVSVLYRMDGSKAAQSNAGFSDVVSSDWYYDAVMWAAEKGIVTGYTDGSFGPNDPLTRQQLAAILYRYSGSPVTAGGRESFASFDDAAGVSDYAISAMVWAVDNGILTGDGASLLPNVAATRAQAAAMLQRYVQNIIG